LNVLPFVVPPLRERREDIAMLTRHFLSYFCSKESRETKNLSAQALLSLANYDWPGNVRELKNLIERLVIMTPEQQIELADLPLPFVKLGTRHDDQRIDGSGPLPDSYREAKELFEKRFLLEKLQKNNWNISRTAEEIGLERSNLHRKIKAYGLEQGE
jgi:two-component system nitrogen regulation response regulator NtrX